MRRRRERIGSEKRGGDGGDSLSADEREALAKRADLGVERVVLGVRHCQQAVGQAVEVVGHGLGVVRHGRAPGGAEGEEAALLLLQGGRVLEHALEEVQDRGAQPELGVDDALLQFLDEMRERVRERLEDDGERRVFLVAAEVRRHSLSAARQARQ